MCHSILSSVLQLKLDHSIWRAISIKPLLTLQFIIFPLSYHVVAIWVDVEIWSMSFIFFVKAIYNCTIIENYHASAMSDCSACLQFYKFNRVTFVFYFKVSWPVIANIPRPLAIPSISYPGINITKSVKKQNSYFTIWTELLWVVNGFSLVINCADVIIMRAVCQSVIVLRL